MKSENSTREFCWKTTLQKKQSKLNDIWNFDPRILLKDNFYGDSIKIKWNLKIPLENSVERQLYRRLNQNEMKSENLTKEFCWKTSLQKTQLKLNVNWKFHPRILLKDNFTEDAIEIKWNLIIRPENSVERQLYRRSNENWMKSENSNREFCWKTTLQNTKLKLNEIWKFDLRILLKDHFTEVSIKIKWNLKIRHENSAERQLYRRRNQNEMKSENSSREFCWKSTLQKTQSKLNEIWKIDPRILLKDNFYEDSNKVKWNLKISPENSVERQLYRRLNQK